MSSQCSIEGNFVHPCVIKGQETLVHAHDLALRDPAFYQQLLEYAKANHYALVADRRTQDNPDQQGRRRAWLPVIVLSLGLNAVAAAEKPSAHGGFNNQQGQSVLSLFHPTDHDEAAHLTIGETADHSFDNHFEYELEPSEGSEAIESILLDHYQSAANDPSHIQADLVQIARYLSQYPEAVALISSLADKPWKLRHADDTFETEVRGNAFQVQAVDIRFDSRAAAKLRSHRSCETQANACIASPADALLHELLHARSALLETKTFIAQGGMSSVLYPYAHEYDVIKKENALYKAMSMKDGVVRPQRHRHAGKLVASSCSFCIQ
ncbi:hypothetical protein BST96_19285 [Oceanicoccus sagamiensis]|uniref:Uncharacterized protein n=2 Tax=Oceanicoccus sagamiensis TaxID=716816 RepID=A0A1X9NDE1_9GAMM|nr:hypothetical protein BST96_19285 [Oceanicoccus sagamiensis]